MAKSRTYGDSISAAIHEMVSDCHDAGVIDEETMRSFDDSCLVPLHEFTPEEIRALRERELAKPLIFAHYLGISEDLVRRWESGEEHPNDGSLKLLSLVERKGEEFLVQQRGFRGAR
jgi:putative transcriptional regulator